MTTKEFNEKYKISDELASSGLIRYYNDSNSTLSTLAGKPKKLVVEILKRFFSNWIYVTSLIVFLAIFIMAIVITLTSHYPSDKAVNDNLSYLLVGNNPNGMHTDGGVTYVNYLPPKDKPFVNIGGLTSWKGISKIDFESKTQAFINPSKQTFYGLVGSMVLNPDGHSYVRTIDPAGNIVYRVNIYNWEKANAIYAILTQSLTNGTISDNYTQADVRNYINEAIASNPQINFNTILGTNSNGFDIWTRSWVGTWNAIWIALVIATAQTVIGVAIGAYLGFHAYTLLDTIMMRVIAIISSPPTLVVLLVGVSLFGTTNIALILILTFLGWPGSVGITRMFIITVKNQEFITASKLVGASKKRLIFRHALPAIIGKIANSFVSTIPGVIFSVSSLAFLGFFKPTSANLGAILGSAATEASTNIWILLLPLIILMLITISLQFVALGVHDALDPKVMRKK